jgi:hypothetical protein
MAIVNTAKDHGEHIDQLRGAIEHRATWMYLLLDEARKRGLDWDDFARAAITKCGHFHGKTKFSPTESIQQFGTEFASKPVTDIFDMNVVELNDERFVVEFNYCPLVNGWLKQTDSEEDIDALCDIAMDGDRGIIEEFPAFSFDLQSTIARGDKVCRLVISRKP